LERAFLGLAFELCLMLYGPFIVMITQISS
jgi:hypothetical protein